VWPVLLAQQVLPRPPRLIFPLKTWFFGIYLNFSAAAAEITYKSIISNTF
jgi:hypothetical protein